MHPESSFNATTLPRALGIVLHQNLLSKLYLFKYAGSEPPGIKLPEVLTQVDSVNLNKQFSLSPLGGLLPCLL